MDGFRIPRPTRDADRFVAAVKRGEYKAQRIEQLGDAQGAG